MCGIRCKLSARCRIHIAWLVGILVSAQAVNATGWTEPLWADPMPSRYTSISESLPATNVWSYLCTITVTVSTATGSLPGYSPNGYVYHRPESMFWPIQLSSFGGLPIGVPAGQPSNSFTVSVRHIGYSMPDKGSGWDDLSVGNTVDFVWPLWVDPIADGAGIPSFNEYQIGHGSWTQTIVETGIKHAAVIQTNVLLNCAERREMEAFEAFSERWYALTQEMGPIMGSELRPKFFRSERRNLTAVKQWIKEHCQEFVDVSQADGGSYSSYLAGRLHDISWPMWTVTGLLAYVDAPTNYLDFTPGRNLHGVGPAIGRYVTNTVTLVGDGPVVTNLVATYCGDAVEAVGTNGEVVSVVCTNEAVEEGKSELDYGWKYIKPMLNLLTDVPWPTYWVSGNDDRRGCVAEINYTNPPVSWSHAKSDAQGCTNNPPSEVYFDQFGVATFGECDRWNYEPGGDTAYWAYWLSCEGPLATDVTFPIASIVHSVGFYLYVTSPVPSCIYGAWPADCYPQEGEFDGNSDGFSLGWNHLGDSSYGSASAVTSAVIGELSIGEWCAEPPVINLPDEGWATSSTARGWNFRAALGVVRFQFAYGP